MTSSSAREGIETLRFDHERKTMRVAGFRLITLGPGTVVDGKPVATSEQKARAIKLNDEWPTCRGVG